MKISSTVHSALARLRKFMGRKDDGVRTSLVLLVSEPYYQSEELYAKVAATAFRVPYDGSDPMHCVVPTKNFFFLKAGSFLITILPHHGAYLAETGEYDTSTGAKLVEEDEKAWWHMQRAWTAFDLQNEDVDEAKGIQMLARLVLPLLGPSCCGVWIPSRGMFLPNDGRAAGELGRLSQSGNCNIIDTDT